MCPQPNPCNYDYSCQPWNGETTENCAQDCPPSNPCNYDNSCQSWNGETTENCPQDCPKDGGGGETDYSSMKWTSSWNSALEAQQGYGTQVDWGTAYASFDSCLATCGNDLSKCREDWAQAARHTCMQASIDQQGCTDTMSSVVYGPLQDWQASMAHGNAQSQSGCRRRQRQRRLRLQA